jgi:hypothetical protein
MKLPHFLPVLLLAPALASAQTTEYTRSWHLQAINAQAAYDQGWTGKGVTVGIIDTGVTRSSEIANRLPGVSFTGGGTVDLNNHGSHVAGIVAAAKNGVGIQGIAYNATILPIQVLGTDGTGSLVTVNKGIDAAVAAKAQVINLSLGINLGYNTTTQNGNGVRLLMGDSVLKAVQAGTSVVVAAGNDYLPCTSVASTYAPWKGQNQLTCSFPAALPAVSGYEGLLNAKGGFLAVGAVDDKGKIASFSNRAGVMADWYMVAPGVKVTSTDKNGNLVTMSGTSMAAPMVTGAYALLAEKFPHLQGSQITQILLVSAKDLGAPGVDEVYGHGMLDIGRAMQPLGTLKLPVGKTVAQTRPLDGTVVAAPFAAPIGKALSNVMVTDGFDRGYTADLSSLAVTTPSFSFDQFTWDEAGPLLIGRRYQSHLPQEAQPIAFGLRMGDWSVATFREQGLFGAQGQGGTQLESQASRTQYMRLGHRWHPSRIDRIEANLDYGVTPAREHTGLVTRTSTLHGLGGSVHWTHQVDRHAFKLGYALPVQIVKGSAELDVPVNRTLDGEIVTEHRRVDLAGRTREHRLMAGWSHTTRSGLESRLDLARVQGVDSVHHELVVRISGRF